MCIHMLGHVYWCQESHEMGVRSSRVGVPGACGLETESWSIRGAVCALKH